MPYGQACYPSSQGTAAGLCFLRVDIVIDLCEVREGSEVCLRSSVGSGDPCCGSPVLCFLTLVD